MTPLRIAIVEDEMITAESIKDMLEDLGYEVTGIHIRATKALEAIIRDKRFNTLVGKTRFKVERTFGGIKLWFGGGVARYRGLEKMHNQNIMEALCYNLYPTSAVNDTIANTTSRDH